MAAFVSPSFEAHHSPAVKRLGATILMSPDEIAFLENLQSNRLTLSTGETLIQDGDDFNYCYIMRAGWALRWRTTVAGRRQIVNIYLPGDFIGIQVNFHRKAAFTISALNELEVAVVEPLRILDVYKEYPVLASGLDWATVRNFNIVSEHNVSLGARDASARILHLFLELWCRLLVNGEAKDTGFAMPLNQQQIGDVVGLSLVHTNKSIARLRHEGLITTKNNRIEFPDVSVAIDHADFDGRFLDQFRIKGAEMEAVERAMAQ